MNRSIFRTLITLLITLGVTGSVVAQELVRPWPSDEVTYQVRPDYRRCAAPMCGGWFLTPVNQFSRQLETEEEAYENSLSVAKEIYIYDIDYSQLELTREQLQELQTAMRSQQALLRGAVSTSPISRLRPTPSLRANGAWVSANTREPYGPFLSITSTGIACITTPCPYYRADLINTLFSTVFDELNLEKAELDREQTTRAWRAVATDGLVITGVRYSSKGLAGQGTGIAATKVYFAFPKQ